MDLTFWLARGVWLCLITGCDDPLITPVMSIDWICHFRGVGFAMLKSREFGNLIGLLLTVQDDLIGSTKVGLCEISECFRGKFWDDQ